VPKTRRKPDLISRRRQITTELRESGDGSKTVTRPVALLTYEHRGTPQQTALCANMNETTAS